MDADCLVMHFSLSLNACIGNLLDQDVEHMQIVYTLLNMHSIWSSNQLCVPCNLL